MAFNPFRHFRKNMKPIMAVVTVMCMIIFVFQFGAGDVFSRVLGWFGSASRKGQEVVVLYGSKVVESELDDTRRRRKLATEFIGNLMFAHQESAVEKYIKPKLGADDKGPLGGALDDTGPLQGSIGAVAKRLFQHAQMTSLYLRIGQQPQPLPSLETDLALIHAELESPGIGKDRERLRAVQSVATLGATFAWMMSRENLFGGDLSNRELLDFMIWKHQADHLGITLTDADVGREANRMFGFEEVFTDGPFEQEKVVQDYLGNDRADRRAGPANTAPLLLEALRDEFRVQLAKEAILGHGSGWRAWYNRVEPTRVSPAATTPSEFYDYFRDMRTTLKVALLDLPTGNFLDSVSARPSRDELLNLYAANRDKEPKPDQRSPGFKEPRRIRVQFLRADPNSPFYQKAAKEKAATLTAYADPAWSAALRVAAGLSPDGAGGLYTALAALHESYDPLETELRQFRSGWPTSPVSFETAALGRLLAVHQPGPGTALTLASVLPELDSQVRQTTLRAYVAEILAAGGRQALGGTALSALTMSLPFTAPPLSREALLPQMLDNYAKGLARKLAEENLHTFQAELRKLKGKKSEETAYIETAVPQYGFEDFTTMDEAVSMYAINDVPKLKKLKDALTEYISKFSPGPHDDILGAVLSQGTGLYEPDQVPDPRLGGMPTITSIWSFWRCEDHPPRSKSFDQVADQVEQAWRVKRAQGLAQTKADRIKKYITDNKLSAVAAVDYLQKTGHVIELDKVARLVGRLGDEDLPGAAPKDLVPYDIPRDKLRYPPDDFLDQLMKLKAPGQALVLSDRPAKHFYVVVLESRRVPEVSSFIPYFEMSPTFNRLYLGMQQQRDRDLDQELMKQLRVEAAGKDNIDEQGRIKVPEGIRGEPKGADAE